MYKLPDAKGFTAMSRKLINRTEEQLQELREQVMATTLDDFRHFADAAELLRNHGQTVILGSKDGIVEANPDAALTSVL